MRRRRRLYPSIREDEMMSRMHVDHCIETLRLNLMCYSDITPVLFLKDESRPTGDRVDFNKQKMGLGGQRCTVLVHLSTSLHGRETAFANSPTVGLCGGIFLDKNFLELVKTATRGSWHNISKKEELKFMNDNWEHGIKRQFHGRPRTWIVDQSDIPHGFS